MLPGNTSPYLRIGALSLSLWSIALSLVVGWFSPGPPGLSSLGPSSLCAEELRTQPQRPLATKSSNTWICILVAGVVAIVVFFIGRAERRSDAGKGPQAGDARSEKAGAGDEEAEK